MAHDVSNAKYSSESNIIKQMIESRSHATNTRHLTSVKMAEYVPIRARSSHLQTVAARLGDKGQDGFRLLQFRASRTDRHRRALIEASARSLMTVMRKFWQYGGFA
jgi:hypothetical protein